MKYPEKIYSRLLSKLMLEKMSPEKEKEIAEKFAGLLEKNNDSNKLKRITELAENYFLKESPDKKIILETARKIKPADLEKIISQIAGKHDRVEEKINPEIIAGLRIIINSEKRFDGSLANKLKEIFQ